MGKIACDAGHRNARRGSLYPKTAPELPVTSTVGEPSASVLRHRENVRLAAKGEGPMYTAPRTGRA